jgi:hypothetical protein
LTTSDNQLYLFSDLEKRAFNPPGVPRQPLLDMDCDALQRWKVAIANYQQHIRVSQPEQQGTLFEAPQSTVDPDGILFEIPQFLLL